MIGRRGGVGSAATTAGDDNRGAVEFQWERVELATAGGGAEAADRSLVLDGGFVGAGLGLHGGAQAAHDLTDELAGARFGHAEVIGDLAQRPAFVDAEAEDEAQARRERRL